MFACGHTSKVVVGNAPGVSEETVRAFVEKAAAGKCHQCVSQAGRLRYTASSGGSTEEKRARD